MRVPVLIAVGLSLAIAMPRAEAADLATLDCVAGGASSALRERIDREVARNLAESGKRPSYDPAIGEELRRIGGTCATEHGWSEDATRSAVVYALARIGLATAQRVVDEKGFDAATLEDQFQQLPEETRQRPLSTADMQAVVIASVPDEAQQTRENAELLNEFFLFLSTMQYAAYDFSQA